MAFTLNAYYKYSGGPVASGKCQVNNMVKALKSCSTGDAEISEICFHPPWIRMKTILRLLKKSENSVNVAQINHILLMIYRLLKGYFDRVDRLLHLRSGNL